MPKWLAPRRASEDTQLGEGSLPRGARIDLCAYVVQRSPALWPEPEKFQPERFGPGREVTPYAYFPFLFGPHTAQ